jgi:hypothetical protein
MRDDIKTAIEFCTKENCNGCPYEYENCIIVFRDYITELEAINADLSVENDVLRRDRDNLQRTVEEGNEELKDYKSKFESGKLVEFKYAVGDEVFFLSYSDDNLDEEFCYGHNQYIKCGYLNIAVLAFDNDYCEDKSKLMVRKAVVTHKGRFDEGYSIDGSGEFNSYNLRLEYKGEGDAPYLETFASEDKLFATKEKAEAKLKERKR